MRVETMAIFCSALCSKNELAFSIFPEVKRFVSAERHQFSLAGVQVHNSCYCQCNSSPIDVLKLVPDKKLRWYGQRHKIRAEVIYDAVSFHRIHIFTHLNKFTSLHPKTNPNPKLHIFTYVTRILKPLNPNHYQICWQACSQSIPLFALTQNLAKIAGHVLEHLV